jgi:hypothetical protein
MQTVTIYLNAERDELGRPVGFFGFAPEHKVAPVFAYATEAAGVDAAHEAFEILNAPEEYLTADKREIARRYRGMRLPSLSVGDVVVVEAAPDGTPAQVLAVASVGFDPVPGLLNVAAYPARRRSEV